MNGEQYAAAPVNGYVYIPVQGNADIVLTLDGTPRFVYASPKVPRLKGCAAICRGPLVYCFEGADNDGDVLSLKLGTNGTITESRDSILGGTVKLAVPAVRVSQPDGLYTSTKPAEAPCTAYAVPYYAWGNRGENQGASGCPRHYNFVRIFNYNK